MPRGAWSAKDERQYAAIKKSCVASRGKRQTKTCTRIAAATVNKRRREEGRTLSGVHGVPTWVKVGAGIVVALSMTLIIGALVKARS